MRLKQISMISLGMAIAATVSFMPSRGWSQEQADAAAVTKVNPSTGVAAIAVAKALSCPNVACESGDTCTFETLIGSAQSFSRFGAGLGKATILACTAINTTTAVSVGSGANGDTTCSPATGTVIFTQSSKAAGTITLAFAGNVCTLPTAPTKQVLNAAYILTGTTIKNFNSASGNVTAGYDTVTGLGDLSFQGTKD